MNNEDVMGRTLDEIDELYHYGVPGMKWGVRRTPAQLGHKPSSKKRRNQAKKYVENLMKKHKAKKDAKKAADEQRKKDVALKKKSIEEMSDEELAKYVNRKNAERTALSIERDINTLKPEKVSAGKKLAAALGDKAVGALAGAGERLMKEAMNKAIEKALGNGAADPLMKLKKEADAAGYNKIKSEAKKAAIEAMEKEYNFKQRIERDRAKAEEAKASTKTSSDSSKVYEGTVEWSNFKQSTSSQQKTGRTVVDAESWDSTPASSMRNSDARALGQSYVAGLLPAPKDDD